MAYSELITLLDVIEKPDLHGALVKETINSTELLAEQKSVNYSHYYSAQNTNVKLVCIFLIADYYDYNNQKYLLHNNVLYEIDRTFRKNESNILELSVKNTKTTL